MNLAEFNYLHREKVENQLVLPHPPTYVTQEKNKGRDVWYFTSEKFITLKKKPQNTIFSNFLKTPTISIQPNQKHEQNQTQSTNPPTAKQPLTQSSKQKNQSLLFIFKQRTNYLQSKLTHIINDHQQPSDKIIWSHEKSRCMICEQLQANDYDFIVMQKQMFLTRLQQQQNNVKYTQGLTQCQTSQLAYKLDRILKKSLFQNPTSIHQKQLSKQTIHSSTFNQYLDNLGSQFKYYITRIQTQKQKHHYMIENKNRINYRRKIHSNTYTKQQQLSNDHYEILRTIQNDCNLINSKNNKQIKPSISSVVWNRQYVLFDVEKINKNQIDSKLQSVIINNDKLVKVTNSHMKQKITEKCQLIQKLLEKSLNKLFEQKFKNKPSTANEKKNEENSINKMKYSTNVKQFRLWFMNNNMKNNHAYTICISDLKVQFSTEKFGMTSKKWQGDFWTRIDLKNGIGIINQVQENRLNIKLKNTISSTDRCSIRLITKSNHLPHMKRQNYYIKRQSTTSQTLEYKETVDFKQQQPLVNTNTNNNQQNCRCCLSLIINSTNNNIQTVLSKHLIISRHIPILRQIVRDQIQSIIGQIKQQLSITSHTGARYTTTRPPQQLQKQNQLIQQLQRNQEKLINLKSLNLSHERMNNKQQSITFSRKKDLEDIYKREYEEVIVCEQCYTTFLLKLIKSNHPPKPSIPRLQSTTNNNKSNTHSKKATTNSFFHKQATTQSEKQSEQRQHIYSANTTHHQQSFEKPIRHNHHHLYSNQLNTRQKIIINSSTTINSRRIHPGTNNNQLQQQLYHKVLRVQKQERMSTKDNTTILELFTENDNLQRKRGNSGHNGEKKKKKTRLEKYQEDLENQYF